MTNVQTPNNIDEFRAREEQRELEHEQQTVQSTRVSTDNVEPPKEESAKIKKNRADILNASLLFVGAHGWSRDAIANGAEQIGYPGIIHGMFPNGGIELINHFYMQCNERLMDQLNEELLSTATDGNGDSQNPVQNPLDMLKRAIRLRLQMNEPYLSNWRQALAVMALPPNVPTSLAQLLTLVDDICHYAGDRSVDVRFLHIFYYFVQSKKKSLTSTQFGWYTRRIGLATIYKMTEVFMLADTSPGHEETWKFLDRRLEECHQVLEALQATDATTKNMTRALNSVFLTVS